MLRIGRIEYTNCTPIFHALNELYGARDEYRYIAGVPSRLNQMLASGDIDVCPSSSIEFAFHPEKHLIIPGLSISSCGPVLSVLLFSSLPIEELDNQDILLSSESATSVNLLKILLRKKYGLNCRFMVTNSGLSAALKQAPAVLLIGDPALRALTSAQDVHIYDLGELWYQWTGRPFVFALWLASRAAYDNQREELREFVRRVWHAREYALQHLEETALASTEVVWMEQKYLLQYWRENISYELAASHIEGLNLFFSLAAELDLIATPPHLTFLDIGLVGS